MDLFSLRDSNGNIANYDAARGIHYGAISMCSIAPEIFNDFTPYYGADCAQCGLTVYDYDEKCAYCDAASELTFTEDLWNSFDGAEPSGYIWRGDKAYAIEYAEDLACYIVTRSPHYTYAALCSPCVPNAGDLDTPRDLGVKTFCLDASYFDNEIAPYAVFDVQ